MTLTKQAEKRELVGLIDGILQDIEKQAEAKTEAGGYDGKSTHPIAQVDDGTQEATEGARSAENTSDTKAEPNRGQTPDEATDGPGAGQDSVQMDVGITSKATGEDPQAETSSAKGGKEDSETTHPARTDNGELGGGKYASDLEAMEDLCKKATELGSQLVAAIASNANGEVKQAEQAAAPEQAEKAAAEEPAAAPVASNTICDTAGIFANLDVPQEDKQAADAMVVDTLTEIIDTAQRRAEKAASFFNSHFEALKTAEEEEAEDGEEAESSDPLEAAGEEPSAPVAPAAPEEGGAGEEDIAALLAGGEDMGAEQAVTEMGGEPGAPVDPAAAAGPPAPEAGLGAPPAPEAGLGAPPEAGLGAPPEAGMGGSPAPPLEGMEGGEAGMGELGGGDELAQLEQILAELGITPEELELAIAGKQAAALKKRAAEKQATDTKQKKYAAMKQMITELVGRSREAAS